MPHAGRRRRLEATVAAIKASGLSIYDSLEALPSIYLNTESLELLLNRELAGLDLNYPIRTRSKVLKTNVCEILGYPVPKSFKRSHPRFPGQNFDTYVQKSNNLQIWNQQIAPSRRYVIVGVNAQNTVTRVRVVTGKQLAELDKTGTLTHKYQAKSKIPVTHSVLVSPNDTANVVAHLSCSQISEIPRVEPSSESLRLDLSRFLPVPELFKTLESLVSPDSTEQLADFPDYHHCDVRYAVFYASPVESRVRLDAIILTTGADFFNFFQRFEGKIRNAKLQIPLPGDFFA